MKQSSGQDSSVAIIMIMGGTGTGKSTFINLLTNDDAIRIGHNQESETFGVQTAHYIDQDTGHSVMLVDTPGFDDSREGVTDTDLLEKIVRFLEPESGKRIKVNGIIYMHRISDPRVSGSSRKNIKMFHSLCGETSLENVRIVTTNWSRVSEDEGNHREADLEQTAFKALLDAGAQMRRHTNTVESACQIMSELIPLKAVTMKIQEELQAGKKLVDTAAGMVLAAEMLEMEKKHEREMVDLKREMNNAEESNDQTLRTELQQERKILEERMARANDDRKRLEETLDAVRVGSAGEKRIFESPLRPCGKTEEVSGTVKALPVQCEDMIGAKYQLPQKWSKQGESKFRSIAGSSRKDDATTKEETPIQILMEQFAREHKAQIEQIERAAARRRESEEAELRLESNVQRLQANIMRATEREKNEVTMRKKVVEGVQYILVDGVWHVVVESARYVYHQVTRS